MVTLDRGFSFEQGKVGIKFTAHLSLTRVNNTQVRSSVSVQGMLVRGGTSKPIDVLIKLINPSGTAYVTHNIHIKGDEPWGAIGDVKPFHSGSFRTVPQTLKPGQSFKVEIKVIYGGSGTNAYYMGDSETTAAIPPSTSPSISVSPSIVRPGEQVTVTLSGGQISQGDTFKNYEIFYNTNGGVTTSSSKINTTSRYATFSMPSSNSSYMTFAARVRTEEEKSYGMAQLSASTSSSVVSLPTTPSFTVGNVPSSGSGDALISISGYSPQYKIDDGNWIDYYGPVKRTMNSKSLVYALDRNYFGDQSDIVGPKSPSINTKPQLVEGNIGLYLTGSAPGDSDYIVSAQLRNIDRNIEQVEWFLKYPGELGKRISLSREIYNLSLKNYGIPQGGSYQLGARYNDGVEWSDIYYSTDMFNYPSDIQIVGVINGIKNERGVLLTDTIYLNKSFTFNFIKPVSNLKLIKLETYLQNEAGRLFYVQTHDIADLTPNTQTPYNLEAVIPNNVPRGVKYTIKFKLVSNTGDASKIFSATDTLEKLITRVAKPDFGAAVSGDINVNPFIVKPFSTKQIDINGPTAETYSGATPSYEFYYSTPEKNNYTIGEGLVEGTTVKITRLLENTQNVANEKLSFFNKEFETEEGDYTGTFNIQVAIKATDDFNNFTVLQREISLDFREAPYFDLSLSTFSLGIQYAENHTLMVSQESTELQRVANKDEEVILNFFKAKDKNNDLKEYQIGIQRLDRAPNPDDYLDPNRFTLIKTIPNSEAIINNFSTKITMPYYEYDKYLIFGVRAVDYKGLVSNHLYSETYLIGSRVGAPTIDINTETLGHTDNPNRLNIDINISSLGGSQLLDQITQLPKDNYLNRPNFERNVSNSKREILTLTYLSIDGVFNYPPIVHTIPLGNKTYSQFKNEGLQIRADIPEELRGAKLFVKTVVQFNTGFDKYAIGTTPPKVYYADQPTISRRAHQVGINTTNFEEKDLLNISSFNEQHYVRLSGVGLNQEAINVTVDLRTGEINGSIINGGSWD